MRSHASISRDTEANAAAYEAAKGAAWGIPFLLLSLSGYVLSPIYRSLTIQFKVFLQMSGMTVGSMIEADRRLRAYEGRVRMEKRIERDEGAWKAFEEGFRRDEEKGAKGRSDGKEGDGEQQR
ncbi:hypothetical protein MMC24_004682 [Lignoscripta atroalba]|nr:hypothetical protein [Lignoscripta atroalba]